MIIKQATSHEDINHIVNFAELMTRCEHITLYSNQGVMVFTPELTREPGVYNITLYVHPNGRGAWGRDFINRCFDKMFEEYDAIELQGSISHDNKACLKMLEIVDRTAEITHLDGFTRCVFT